MRIGKTALGQAVCVVGVVCILAVAGCQPVQPKKHTGMPHIAAYDAAKKLYSDGKYQKAIQALQAYLKKYKSNPPGNALTPVAQLYIGDAYKDLKQLANAEAAYKKVIADYPKSKCAGDAKAMLDELSRKKSKPAAAKAAAKPAANTSPPKK